MSRGYQYGFRGNRILEGGGTPERVPVLNTRMGRVRASLRVSSGPSSVLASEALDLKASGIDKVHRVFPTRAVSRAHQRDNPEDVAPRKKAEREPTQLRRGGGPY